MTRKTRRNEPCPCGSGKKYKNCHLGSTENPIPPMNHDGLMIKDYTWDTEKFWTLGAPGLEVGGMVYHHGDILPIINHLENHRFILSVDIPILLPLSDSNKERYVFQYLGNPYFYFHKIKTKGEEYFSTIDTQQLPYFSSLQIHGFAFNDMPETADIAPADPPIPFSYQLILHVLHQINSFLDESKFDIGETPILSYFILYFNIEDNKFKKALVKSTYPYSGVIKIMASRNQEVLNTDKFKIFLSESLKVQGYSQENIVPKTKDESFSNSVFISAHDFAFYSNQHPKAVGKLHEEQIRDLYLVVLKCVFESAEGESYNYDGKTDFKITNTKSKYEFIIGEFKFWKDQSSIVEAFHQLVRKHCTGQELQLYLIIMSKNKDAHKVNEKLITSIANEKEYVKCVSKNIAPTGSKQLFSKHLIKTKGEQVPLILGLINLYHSKE